MNLIFRACCLRPSLYLKCTTYCRELTHTPNDYKLEAANTRSRDRTFAVETLGCRQGKSEEKRVYTLPTFPGVYNNHEGTPRCASHWTRRCTPYCGPHQASFLVERPVGRRQPLRAILSGLSAHEIRPQEKGGFVTVHSPTKKKMAADYD